MNERTHRSATSGSVLAWLTARPVGLLAGGAIILLLLVIAAWMLLRPSYEPLLKGLSQESQSEVMALLAQWDVPHRIDTNETILVPAGQAPGVRTRLSAHGVPTRERAGLELFGQSDQGMSEFSQRINYQRALEGELERTIQALDEVRSARVHLTLAKSSIFENKREAAKGSVVLQLKPERSLSARQIGGIQQLVAAAVTDMQAENVVVLDEMGRPLSSRDGGGDEVDQLGHQLRLESLYEERARNLIAGLVPDAELRLSVRLQLNFNRVTSVREDLIPADGSAQGYLLKQRGRAADAKAGEAEYAFGRERAEIQHAPGAIEHLHIGVVVSKPLSESQIASIEAVLIAGLGIAEANGDTLAVVGAEPASVASEDSPVTVVWGDPDEADAEVTAVDTVTASTVVEARPAVSSWAIPRLDGSMLPWAGALLLAALLVVLLRRRAGRKPGPVRALSEQDRRQILIDARRWLEVS